MAMFRGGVILALVACATAATIPSSLIGTWTGSLTFYNQIPAGVYLGLPVAKGCCFNATYTAQTTLVISASEIIVNQSAVIGPCGPSPQTIVTISAASVSSTSSNCFMGTMGVTVQGVALQFPQAPVGILEIDTDGTVKLNPIGSITDASFFNVTGQGPIVTCPFQFTGGMSPSGLPCATTTAIELIAGDPLLVSQAVTGKFTKNQSSAALFLSPSVSAGFIAAVVYVARLLL